MKSRALALLVGLALAPATLGAQPPPGSARRSRPLRDRERAGGDGVGRHSPERHGGDGGRPHHRGRRRRGRAGGSPGYRRDGQDRLSGADRRPHHPGPRTGARAGGGRPRRRGRRGRPAPLVGTGGPAGNDHVADRGRRPRRRRRAFRALAGGGVHVGRQHPPRRVGAGPGRGAQPGVVRAPARARGREPGGDAGEPAGPQPHVLGLSGQRDGRLRLPQAALLRRRAPRRRLGRLRGGPARPAASRVGRSPRAHPAATSRRLAGPVPGVEPLRHRARPRHYRGDGGPARRLRRARRLGSGRPAGRERRAGPGEPGLAGAAPRPGPRRGSGPRRAAALRPRADHARGARGGRRAVRVLRRGARRSVRGAPRGAAGGGPGALRRRRGPGAHPVGGRDLRRRRPAGVDRDGQDRQPDRHRRRPPRRGRGHRDGLRRRRDVRGDRRVGRLGRRGR